MQESIGIKRQERDILPRFCKRKIIYSGVSAYNWRFNMNIREQLIAFVKDTLHLTLVPPGTNSLETSRCLKNGGKTVFFAHGCNTFGAFGDGVAGVVRKECPTAYKAYVDAVNNVFGGRDIQQHREFLMGRICGNWTFENPLVVNMFTQLKPGSGSLSYNAITSCFVKLFEHIQFEVDKPESPATTITRDDVVIVIPAIGCGIAGGEFTEVVDSIVRAVVEYYSKYPEIHELPFKELKMEIWDDGSVIPLLSNISTKNVVKVGGGGPVLYKLNPDKFIQSEE